MYRYEDHPGINSALSLDCYGDLRNDPIRLISMFRPDVVINCSGDGRQNAPAKDLWQANATNVLNLLEACRVLPKVKFAHCSSIVCENEPGSVYTPYRASKIAAEELVKAYSKTSNVSGLIIRFPAVVGAGNRHGVVKDIVRKLKGPDKHLKLFGSKPGSCKPFVYAGQLSKCILDYISKTDFDCTVLRLCAGDFISVENVAYMAMELTGIGKEIRWDSGATWKYDQNVVFPTGSSFFVMDSCNAVKAGIKDILAEDYNGI